MITLGTGIPLPNPDRATAATLVVVGDRSFLVDTGRGSFVRLAGAGYRDVSAVLYTHFHSDHIADLGEIVVARAIGGADKPLKVLGPKGTQEVVTGLLAGYKYDTQYRVVHHPGKYSGAGASCDVEEHTEGVIYEEDGLKITMFDVDHEPIVPAVGYRFDYDGKSIVISGDTKKNANLQKYAEGCDILVHEVMNANLLNGMLRGLKRANPRMGEMLEETMGHHTSTIEVAEIARDAKVKKVVLTHFLPSMPATDAAEKNFIRGMSDVFTGEIIVARDGMTVVP